MLGPASLEADEVGLREVCGETVNTAGWAAVGRVDETETHGFVFVGPLAAVIVPKRAEGAEDMLRLVRERLGQSDRAA